MYKVGLWGFSQESASCNQQMHELRDGNSHIILRGDWRCNTCGINNFSPQTSVTSTSISLQQVYYFNKCITSTSVSLNKFLTSTSISLQQVFHYKCITSTSVSLQQVFHYKCITSTSVSLNKCITQQVSHFNKCLTSTCV